MKKLFNYLSLAVLCTFVAVSCGPDEPEVDTAIELSTEVLNFTAEGSTETVDVTAGTNWKVTANRDWIEIVEGESSFDVTVGENDTEESRSGTITVKNSVSEVKVAVTQVVAGELVLDPTL